jgi:hypothetical protein
MDTVISSLGKIFLIVVIRFQSVTWEGSTELKYEFLSQKLDAIRDLFS